MRIENLMKCPMFLPYAGPTDTRGWELKPNKLSAELPATRFFNELLQKDWKAGKIKIYVNSQDNKIIGNDYIYDPKDNSIESPAKLIPDNKPTAGAIKDIPLVSEKEPLSDNLARYTDKMNKVALPIVEDIKITVEDKPTVEAIPVKEEISLADLNSEKTGVPNFSTATTDKADLDQIATFMKGPIG